jgi:hypothetical protein
VITEQEAWDEHMKLMDLQAESILHQSKGIESSGIDRILVFDFVNRMKESGFLESENIQPGFRNWFFRCKIRSIKCLNTQKNMRTNYENYSLT